ncbi:MAG: serine/threonine protein kinase [Chromatiales bacterium]|nr:MAG: serine/threonine protein kinase [Chromatiales bacterium]
MPARPDIAFQALQPEDILGATDSVGQRSDGRLLALNSYENRVYRVGMEDGPPLVAKFYRPGRWSNEQILEEHEFACELAAAEIPVVAPLTLDGATLHEFGPFRFALYPCHGGHPPPLDDTALLRQLGRLVARIHELGARRAFEYRPSITVTDYGTASRDYLLAEGFIPADIEAAYTSICEHLLTAVEQCYARAGEPQAIRVHGDFHPGNVLVLDTRVHIVDLDDARMGPRIQDLWMLLSGDRDEQMPQLAEVLAGYSEFANFDARELHLVEALRTLRIMHYAAWLARRWQDPAFPHAFPWFNTRRYWDEHVQSLKEQLSLMQEPPLDWLPA